MLPDAGIAMKNGVSFPKLITFFPESLDSLVVGGTESVCWISYPLMGYMATFEFEMPSSKMYKLIRSGMLSIEIVGVLDEVISGTGEKHCPILCQLGE